MKKSIPSMLTALLISLSVFFGGDAAAKVYIDVNSPNFRLFPIAICDFNTADAGIVSKSGDLGVALADEIKMYLKLTGFFNPLNKKSFLDDKSINPVIFTNWMMIGADYLVKGTVEQSEKEISNECSLYDVVKGELLFNKKYTAGRDDLKTLAKNIASDILFILTGEEGDFNTQIVFVAKNGDKADIYTVGYDGSELKTVTGHRSIIIAPRWSPDGQFLAFTSFKNDVPAIYIRNLSSGAERKVTSFQGINLCGYWSPDGQRLLMTLSKDGNEELYVLEVQNMRLKRLTSNYAIDVSPSWSPDGKKIAFVSNRGGSPQIYTMDADGCNVKRITFEGSYNTTPAWSPRGGRIAFEGLVNHRFQVFTIGEEGDNLSQLTFDAADNESPSWSPSGRQIAYSSRTGSKSKICVMNANGTNIRILREGGGFAMMPMWSPRLK